MRSYSLSFPPLLGKHHGSKLNLNLESSESPSMILPDRVPLSSFVIPWLLHLLYYVFSSLLVCSDMIHCFWWSSSCTMS
jgi:hypothetical protein